MKRFVVLVGLVVLPLFGFSPPADAVGYGECILTGTIRFSPTSPAAGTWAIGPATIDCQGIIGKRARITGRGPFRGSGDYAAMPPGDNGCLRQTGNGNVEYEIPTASGRILINEAVSHTLAGVGTINTPTLHGTFQVAPPYDGDCVTKPVTRASFTAEMLLYRYPREVPEPNLPGFLVPGR